MLPRRALAFGLVLVPVLLAGCSNGGGTSPTTSPTPAPTSASPTASPTDSPTTSPTASPTGTTSPSPSGSPSTVSPSPAVGIEGITVVYSPTTAAVMQQVSIIATTNPSLAGKPVYIVKLNDGAPRVISTGSTINAQGVAKTFAQLGRTGVLELVVPAQQLQGTPDALGSFPFDPTTKLLARSGEFTVTVG